MRHLIEASAFADNNLVGGASLKDRALEVAAAAAAEAEAVDRDGLFPAAALAAAKRLKLLSLLVPTDFGGQGSSASDVAEVCHTIAGACASAGMIIAMHHTALACVIDHATGSKWHEGFLRRMATEEFLVASSTTEGNEGGNVRSSASPLVYADGGITLERAATVISYGLEADCIVSTARKNPEAPPTDQSLIVLMRDDYSLQPTRNWKTLGMRGTCSAGFALVAKTAAEQVLPVPYRIVHSKTMVPFSHLLWGSVWLGIAAAAISKAQAFSRAATRRSEGRTPPGTSQYTRALGALGGLQARLRHALADYDRMRANNSEIDTIENQTLYNLMKVEFSEGALSVVSISMRVCGLAGYREDGEFSIARHLRDVLSAPIMIHNERILANVASAALLAPVNTSLGWRVGAD